MLKKSKSIYFIKRLFTFIDEKTKLDIIKYNKNMQNIMDINLTNYKFYSKKYIINEENGKIKEYEGYNDSSIYEGEYLNGKRNGRGKEFNKNNNLLIFEGEYLNGKRNGKGREYNYFDGGLLFEGEYKNGKRNGKGKEYNIDGKLEYEGDYKNGKRWYGKEYHINGIICQLIT